MSILGMLLLGGAAAAVAGAFDNDKKEPESKVLGQRFALPTESEKRSSSENSTRRSPYDNPFYKDVKESARRSYWRESSCPTEDGFQRYWRENFKYMDE